MLRCILCGGNAEEIDYCFGCNAYICEKCNTYPDTPGGRHEPTVHIELSQAIAALAELQKKIDAIVNKT